MPGVYISWPFCAQKCTYCNFASGVHPVARQQRYLEALCAELRGQEWPWTPDTVYFGGGTPSQMATEQLEAVLRCVPGSPGPNVRWKPHRGLSTPGWCGGGRPWG